MDLLSSKRKPWVNWLLFTGTIVVVFLLGLLAASIIERRAEKEYVYKPLVKIDKYEPRNQVWGMNFKPEYESWLQTADTSFRSKYKGSASIDELAEDPRMVLLWAGYAFAKDYRQSRGHFHAMDDIRNILRTGGPKNAGDGPQPTTCWTCKSPDVPRLMAKMGTKEFYTGKWAALGSEVINPIGCADCHDHVSMDLSITRPALSEAFSRQGKNISNSPYQKMRSLVCAQCHVEYYFDKSDHQSAYLTFPWDKGFAVEDIEKYYDSIQFSDWTHQLSKAPMLKAQHPDYELYLAGIHGQREVSCTDCHMPYKSVGGQKFTDHHIQSPLNNVANTCQVCHREDTKELINNVYERQDKIYHARIKLEDLLVKAHLEAKTAWDKGAAESQMKPVLADIRHAQWRWDFVTASHGASFHAPLEVLKIISSATEIAQEARIKLSRILIQLGVKNEIAYPDISTKEKAQKFIGLDIPSLNKEKESFLKTLVPQWINEGQLRESKMEIRRL